MFIKCCGFQDKDAIETAVLKHVDAIGFITYPKSKRYVSVEEIKSLSKDIPQTIDIVAVVVNLTMVEIDQLIQETSINTLQFHGDESVSFIQEVKEKYPHIKNL